MPIAMKELANNDTISNTTVSTADTVYTAPALTRAHITACTVLNAAASATQVSFQILRTTDTPASTPIVATQNIPALSTAVIGDLLGHIVPVGGTIRAYASAASVSVVTISGFEIS